MASQPAHGATRLFWVRGKDAAQGISKALLLPHQLAQLSAVGGTVDITRYGKGCR
ncbi:hypothetical protein ACU8KH_02694 [Lachancea thermotolerans]